jgi:hypothetical protein
MNLADIFKRPGPTVCYGLSLKQPWATLLVHGVKTIEVRSWRPSRRGRIYIHAARVPDEREEGWKRVPAELQEEARSQSGGIIGVGELVDYRVYRNSQEFARDQAQHLNDPSWFEPPCLFGFLFKNMTALPFQRYPGQTRFFRVELAEPTAGTP